jgi:hypothetical protein
LLSELQRVHSAEMVIRILSIIAVRSTRRKLVEEWSSTDLAGGAYG